MHTALDSRTWGIALVTSLVLLLGQVVAIAQPAQRNQRAEPSAPPTCSETVMARVVALDQAFYVNRFGALQAGGMIFALERDVVSMSGSNVLQPGKVMLRADKRPRPLTLRVNKGQCLEIQFQNLLSPSPVSQKMAAFPGNPKNDPSKGAGSIPTLPPGGYQPNDQELVPSADILPDENGDQRQPPTRYVGVHVTGLEWVGSSADDGSFVGANDVAATGRLSGLVPPGERMVTTLYATDEGAFLLTSGAATVGERLAFGGQLAEGLFGSVIVEPQQAEYYRSQVTREDLDAATLQSKALPQGWRLIPRGPACEFYKGNLKVFDLTRVPRDQRDPNRGTSCVTGVDRDGNPVPDPIVDNAFLNTLGGQPIVNYDAVYAGGTKRAGTPVLSMLAGRHGDRRRELVASDVTAIVTGPFAGAFGPIPPQTPNQTYPENQQPYREFAIHYHDDFMATQAFAAFRFGDMQYTLQGGRDFFAINYGMGAIGASVWANRLQIGPASECATCKFEEFFLSSWPNGDPAMVVDQPVNVVEQTNPPGTKATKAFYPDDPSNVYHSYLRDHVKFRILHAGATITHVHHQHAHQWLHSPKSGVSAYRDSQMISPGATYTLDMVYGGSGNKNLTMGDSIFHCHFYPHFAQGMWALWRVHDVFERGTRLGPSGVAASGPNRALPDGEIARGTPIPGLVPLPTLAMAPVPARVEIQAVTSTAPNGKTVVRNEAVVNQDDIKAGLQPGFPFFVPGIAGQRAPFPPMSFAPHLDAQGRQVEISGEKQHLDGGLPRNVVIAELGSPYEHHNRWDFSKDSDQLFARQLDEDGTPIERAAMSAFSTRNNPSFTPAGMPANFVYNGQKFVRGAPFANPAVHYNGDPVKTCEPTNPNCNDKDFEGRKLTYKSADIQTDVVLNKAGWHYPQQRMSVLWEDVKPTLDGKRRPEPLFIRANSGDVVEFWLTNLIPSYYELDDFQVRTPTDVVGQHIHLVKFDVLASDGAANGFNYESGALAAEEVRTLIGAINKTGGLVQPDGRQKMLTAKSIPDLEKQFSKDDPLILGAQAKVELWYVDPLTDSCLPSDQKEACPSPGRDRTVGTVFTHDHFGPSTHQQAGLYAGLIVEPRNSQWLTSKLEPMGGNDSTTGKPLPIRADGGPIGTPTDGGPPMWTAVIDDGGKRHREFLLEFQDRQLVYGPASRSGPKPYQRYQQSADKLLVTRTNPEGPWGWADAANAVNPPQCSDQLPPPHTPCNLLRPMPQTATNTFGAGAWSLNYRSEPLDLRLAAVSGTSRPNATDTGFAFASIMRNNPLLNVQPKGVIPSCSGADVTISGDLAPGPVWSVGGKSQANNFTVQLKAGQLVCFEIKAGTHGLLFADEATAKSLFDIDNSPQKAQFVINPRGPNTCQHATSYGTAPQSAGVIALLRVRQDVNLTQPVKFECSQHCANMAGSFLVDDTLSLAGGQDAGKNVWFVNGKAMKNDQTLRLRPGQTVRFSVQTGQHGLLFKSEAAAKAVFDIQGSPQASKFMTDPRGPNTCGSPDTFGTVSQPFVSGGDNTIAELTVRNDATMSGVLDFECSQHCANMAGSFALDPVLNIAGDQDKTNDHFWVVDGQPLNNGGTVHLKAGQRVRFTVKNGTHGLLFSDKATADAIFDIASSPQKAKFVSNPRGPNTCGLANAYGTAPQSAVAQPQAGQNTIAELVVKQDITLAQPGQWMSSQHCQGMQGLFIPEGITFLVADAASTRWLVNNEAIGNNTAVVLERGKKLRLSARSAGQILFVPDNTVPATLFENASDFTANSTCSQNGAGLALKSDGTFDELTIKKSTAVRSAAFMSAGPANLCKRMEAYFQLATPPAPFTYPTAFEGANATDPYTPLMRAYPGETVEIRTLVGAHMAPHSFNMHGVKWLFEQDSPNSGFRSTQGMGISQYYQMRFDVPTTNSGADYLYSVTSDTRGLEYGQWGLLRAYNTPQTDLPPLKTPAPAVAEVCADPAPAKSTYKVSIVAASQALSGGKLFFNSRGLPAAGGDGKIFLDGALIYVNDEDLDLTANPIQMKRGKKVEPLILRVAAGDCIAVTVTNRLPTNLLASNLYTRPGVGFFSKVNLTTSLQGGLHPQQVGMDVLKGNGVNLGANPTQTVAPGNHTTFQWYAGSIATDGSRTPVELGAIGLSPADPLMQHPFGLLGALIVEPAGANWVTDDNSRASATVYLPSGKLFREFVLVLQDDVLNLKLTGVQFEGIEFSSATKDQALLQPTARLNRDFTNAFNYRTEPLPYRFSDPAWDSTDPKLAPLGMARALSNSQVMADAQTPVFAVSKGTPTRMRLVHPNGFQEQTFTLAGHGWYEEPFRNNSREIGDNPASQWFGARDSLGANDQVNLVLNAAGGRNKVTGDYLYRSFIGTEFQFGLWGIMRVGEPGRDNVTIAHADNESRGWGYIVAGANTVNPDSGKMAKEVTITASVRPPDSAGLTRTNCTVPVDSVTGEWTSAAIKTSTERYCPQTLLGIVVVDGNNPITVVSSENGRASVTGLIPAKDVPRAEIARTVEELTRRALGAQDKEIIQFKGEKTPQVIAPPRPPRLLLDPTRAVTPTQSSTVAPAPELPRSLPEPADHAPGEGATHQ
jgi:cold shock CspA family protein